MTQAITIGNGKAMMAEAMGVKPMQLQDRNGNKSNSWM